MTPSDVLKTLDKTMAMKTGDWLEKQLKNDENIILIDLRNQSLWEEEHIEKSINVTIQELPDKIDSLIPHKDSIIICICNGSIQSAMAVMYLRTKDYSNSFNLSGGFSSWIRNERPTII
jgi:hydroxyacylglutathione hydrolase